MLNQLTKIGRLFYGTGIVALGVHQLLLKDFRPEILPPFPAWAHKLIIFPILTGIALILAGIFITGLFTIKAISTKKICLYLGFFFLAVMLAFHLPYILILSPDKVSRIDVWFGAAEALAYAGGAFVMAGSFAESNNNKNAFELLLEKLIPFGRIFFAALIILFGCSHFVFTEAVAGMVPKFFGAPLFWTYFVGAALIAAGIAIILKIWMKRVAFLLAIMLLGFFIFFHVPDAIQNPSAGSGNEIVRAIIALMFCGIAMVIAATSNNGKQISTVTI